jgi:hypothetical protein
MALMLTLALASALNIVAAAPLRATMPCPTAASTQQRSMHSTPLTRPAAMASEKRFSRTRTAVGASPDLTAKQMECSEDAWGGGRGVVFVRRGWGGGEAVAKGGGVAAGRAAAPHLRPGLRGASWGKESPGLEACIRRRHHQRLLRS